jgi:hypothetical protein
VFQAVNRYIRQKDTGSVKFQHGRQMSGWHGDLYARRRARSNVNEASWKEPSHRVCRLMRVCEILSNFGPKEEDRSPQFWARASASFPCGSMI